MRIAVLTKFVLRGSSREEMESRLRSQGFRDDEFIWMGVFPSNYDGNAGKGDLKIAREDFHENSSQHNLDGVLAMGNEALFATTGHSGIMKYRGQIDHDGLRPIMPTIALGAIERNPSQIQLLYSDIRALHREFHTEQVAEAQPAKINVVTNDNKLRDLVWELSRAEAVAYDLETSSFDEWKPDQFIVTMALTTLRDGKMEAWAVPLYHRNSPCKGSWKAVLYDIAEACRRVPVRVAHNAKFDCRWLTEFDAPIPCNFDTMLASHLLDENRFKGLKPLAQMLLDADPWDIDIASGKNAPPWYEQHTLKEILKYNALDTWHTMRLYRLFDPELKKQPKVDTLFRKLIMPASQSLVHIEREGVYVHRSKLEASAVVVRENLREIDGQLLQWVPMDVLDQKAINFNPSNFLRWFLFEHLEFPIYKMGKVGPSVSEEALNHIKKKAPHEVIDLLLARVKWQKFQSSFMNPYLELIDENSRLHTTFKLAGTVTGRLSSGKADSDKVSGSSRAALRGINFQQVPRDPLVRGVFGAAPGWSFIEADYSQIELRIAAEISKEPTLTQLYLNNEDVHMTMAMRMTGKPASKITKEERKKAKAVNFGFLYGMGWRKFIETAFNNYDLVVTEAEAQAARTAFFQQFPGLLKWHAQQRRLAHKYQRVQSPLGRIRHLPDIMSPEKGVVGEAERQAINSPVQAMASDLCLLSLVLLDRKFRKLKYRARPIGTVHDAINFECPDDELERVLPLIKETMENPPLREIFGYELAIPIVADIQVGSAWGENTEIPGDIIETPRRLSRFLEGASS